MVGEEGFGMSRSSSQPVEFDVEGSYGSVTKETVVCTHCRSSDTVSFDFSNGEHLVFSDDRWIAMLKADDTAE